MVRLHSPDTSRTTTATTTTTTPPPSLAVHDSPSAPFAEPITRSIPRSNFLAPPSAMSGGEDHGDGAPAAPAAASPFNFQTQVISTAPVKPVSIESYMPVQSLRNTDDSRVEHWPAARS